MTSIEIFLILVAIGFIYYSYSKIHKWLYKHEIKSHGVSAGEQKSKKKLILCGEQNTYPIISLEGGYYDELPITRN